MKIRGWVGFVGMAALVVACGGDDEDDKVKAQPASVNKQLAASSAQSTIIALSASLSGSGANVGPSVAASLASIAQSSQSILQAQPGGDLGTKSVASALNVESGVGTLDFDSAGCACTENSCTFTNCSASGSGSGSQYSFTMDGSYSWGGGHVQCNNLKYTFSGSGSGSLGYSTNVVVTLNCDLTITSSSLKGFLRSAGSSSTEVAGQNTQGTYSSTWDVKTTYNDVTFGANHQPTGGSIRVEGTTSMTVAGQTQSFAGSAEVSFPVN